MREELLDIAGIGEILWDVYPSGRRLGGAPANFIYHARELGGKNVRARMVSCVGADPSGRDLLSLWDRFALNREFITAEPERTTGSVYVSLDPQGKPVYEIAQNVAWDFLPESPKLLEFAGMVDAVCFGTLAQRSPDSRSTIHAFLRRVPSDSLRILDVNLRPPFHLKAVVEESLALANVMKLNEEELQTLAGYFSLSGGETEIVSALMRRFPLQLLALTKGEKGSALYTPKETSVHAGFTVPVVDSVGAGDAFTAAVAMGLLRHMPLEKINECANRVASFVCTRSGAMPEIPAEIKELFQ